MKLSILLVTIPFVAAPPMSSVLVLDGAGDQVDIPDRASLSNLAELTVEAWIYPASGAPTAFLDVDTVACQYSSVLGQRAYFISFHRTIERMRVGINENTGGGYFDGRTRIPLERWSHVAMTYDGSLLTLYVNGKVDTSWPLPGTGITNFDIPHRIGAQAGSSTNFFPGLIDDVRIWNVARSLQEIQEDLRGLTGSSVPGLVGHWLLDDATTYPLVLDASGTGNVGTLLGDAHVARVDPLPAVVFAAGAGKRLARIGAPVDGLGN